MLNKLFKFKNTTKQNSINIGLLPKGGKSSQSEFSMKGFLNGISNLYGFVNPYYPIEIIEYIILLSIMNPDIKQGVSNYITVANSGHQLIVTEENSSIITKAINSLNYLAQTMYKSKGTDGFINDAINQIYVTGALSCESVLEPNLKGVKKVLLVPTKYIRMKYEPNTDDFSPYQVGLNLLKPEGIKLNEITYTYSPHFLLENSPYGVPPLLAALLPCGIQNDMIENIKFLMKKIGLIGFMNIKVKKLPREANETTKQWKERNQKYIDQVVIDTAQNFKSGIMVSPDEQETAFTSIISESRGVRELWQLNEELLFSGMQSLPAWHGRNYTSTETYASVVWGLMIRTAENLRQNTKRTIEKIYRLHLLLQGIAPEKLSVKFKNDLQLNPNTEALARQYTVNNILKLVKTGAIDPDLGAQELGYDKWFNQDRIDSLNQMDMAQKRSIKVFGYDSVKNEYVYNMPVHNLDLISQQNEAKAKAIDEDRKFQAIVREWMIRTLPYFNDLRSDVERFAVEYFKTHIDEVCADANILMGAVVNYMSTHQAYTDISSKDSWLLKESEKFIIDAWKYYKEQDKSIFGGKPVDIEFHFGEGDLAACKFFNEITNFFYSSFLENKDFGSNIKNYVNQFIKNGESNFGGFTDEAFNVFKKLFGKAFADDIEFQFERIIDTTVSRIRTSNHFENLFLAGFKYAIIKEILDQDSCDVCREMNGKKIKVKPVYKLIQNFKTSGSVQAALEWIKNTNISSVDDAKEDMETLLKQGRGFPQYHPRCRGTVQADFEEIGEKNGD